MTNINVAEAKAHFSELVERAAAGEPITITKRGKPMVHLTAAVANRKPIDIAMLRAVTDGMREQAESAGDFMRRIRDEARY